jgi:FtsP/CotA-like multicopper oxidase with cupredoxin domain
VSEQTRKPAVSRRGFLLGGGAGAATIVATALSRGGASAAPALNDAQLTVAGVPDVHLAATDGWASMPAASQPNLAPFWPDPLAPENRNLYVFGFRNVTGLSESEVALQRGKAQISAPQLVFDQDQDYRVKLSNLGLSVRPDLVDGHTIHWHGFVNAIPLFDGVPELSISVPIGRSFTYFYRPHDPGTYMYHCHFEDVEHVQMGMTGLLFVRPKQNGQAITYTDPATGQARTYTKFAYNCVDGSTGYDREFGIFLSEIFAEGHYRDAHIQTTDWTDFKASFWCINGRSYPDTVAPNAAVDPVTSRAVTVSAATASSATRRVTLTFTPALATPVAPGASISVSGFPASAAPYNVSNATVISSTANSVVYLAGAGTLPTSVPSSSLAAVALRLPTDPTHGRGFDPRTTADTDPLKWQPQSALVRCQPGERVLLRLANLGYQNHAMTMDNVPMRIVGKDALLLRNGATAPYRYNYIDTNSVEVGPGESRDVIFTAPAYKGGGGRGYDSYLLYDRNLAYADNAGDPASPGGMLTEVRVYAPGTLPAQTLPNA